MSRPAGDAPPPSPLVGVETIFSGWTKLQRIRMRVASGDVVERLVEDHGAAACVLPYDPARRTALVVRLPRPPLVLTGEPEPRLVEAIAGLIDPGESAEIAARREALEEAGVELDSLEPVGTFWTMPGVSTERMSAYLAACTPADRRGAGGGVAGEHEDIEVIEARLSDLWADLEAGRLADMKLALLLQALRLRRPALFD